MANELEYRKGKGISLLINRESNYGLSHYQPMDENDPRYKRYITAQKCMEEHPDYYYKIHIWTAEPEEVKELTREQTEAYIHCLGCKAEKINNFERYCSLCLDYWGNYI